MMWSIFIWYQDPTPTCDNKGNCTCIDAIGFAQIKHSLYCLLKCWKKLQATKQMHLLKEIQLKHDREEVRERLLYISDLVRWRCTAHMSYRRRSCPAGRRAASHPWSSPLWRSVCSYRSKRDWTSPRAPSAPAPAPVNTHTISPHEQPTPSMLPANVFRGMHACLIHHNDSLKRIQA